MVPARGAWLGVAGLLAFAAFVVPRVAPALTASYERVRDACRNARDTEDEALARFRGPDGAGYVAALNRVKATIPRDGAYYLVSAPDDKDESLYFVRYDLAPRRPQKLESARARDPLRWVVLSRFASPGPEVVETAEYFRAGAGQ